MDALFLVLSIVSLVGVIAYAFTVYQVLRILTTWANARWDVHDFGRRPLLLRLSPRVLTFVLVLVFLALVL